MADVLVLQRYIERDGKLEKALPVVKLRTSRHDTSIRRYAIESSGVVIGDAVRGHGGVLTGVPFVDAEGATPPGLTREEATLLTALGELGPTEGRAFTRKTGMKRSALSRALARLERLDPLRKVRKKGIVLYRVGKPKD